jgi:hypothetical protein
VLWTLLPVLVIQCLGGLEYWRGLIGIEKDVVALVVTALITLTPLVAAVVAGLKIGAVRRVELPPAAA